MYMLCLQRDWLGKNMLTERTPCHSWHQPPPLSFPLYQHCYHIYQRFFHLCPHPPADPISWHCLVWTGGCLQSLQRNPWKFLCLQIPHCLPVHFTYFTTAAVTENRWPCDPNAKTEPSSITLSHLLPHFTKTSFPLVPFCSRTTAFFSDHFPSWIAESFPSSKCLNCSIHAWTLLVRILSLTTVPKACWVNSADLSSFTWQHTWETCFRCLSSFPLHLSFWYLLEGGGFSQTA